MAIIRVLGFAICIFGMWLMSHIGRHNRLWFVLGLTLCGAVFISEAIGRLPWDWASYWHKEQQRADYPNYFEQHGNTLPQASQFDCSFN